MYTLRKINIKKVQNKGWHSYYGRNFCYYRLCFKESCRNSPLHVKLFYSEKLTCININYNMLVQRYQLYFTVFQYFNKYCLSFFIGYETNLKMFSLSGKWYEICLLLFLLMFNSRNVSKRHIYQRFLKFSVQLNLHD